MRAVKDFAPTSFDHSLGAFRAFADKLDWYVCPASQTRDSGLLDRVNFEAQSRALDLADPDGEDHEIHRIGHWGPGWYEIAIVRPGSWCYKTAVEIDGALSEYPILDESAYSEAQYEARCEAWESMSVRDRYELISRVGTCSVFAARHPTVPDDSGILDTLDRMVES